MVIKDGRILKATEEELHIYWLRNWDDIMSWPDYFWGCVAAGTEITKEAEYGDDN